MSARLADDQDDIFEIEQIFSADIKEVAAVAPDPFAKTGDDLKSIRGVSSGQKRQITNELRKYNRNADHTAQSTQINEAELITGYDIFGVVNPPHPLDSLIKLYEMSAPHYAAVNAKVANIVGLGYKLVENNLTKQNLQSLDGNPKKLAKVQDKLNSHRVDVLAAIEALNEEDPFTETLIRVWRDYEVTGNGYIEIGRKRDGSLGYVGHVPAQTMRVRKDRGGFVQISSNRAVFFRNFGDTNKSNPIAGYQQTQYANTTPNEIIHIKKYSPTSTYYGVPDIISAQQAVAGNELAAQYNLDYFNNKAVPRHIITLKGATMSPTARAELIRFFETGLKGQSHRSLFVPLPPDTPGNSVELNIEPVETGNMDASFDKYRRSNTTEILMVHRVPISKISISDSASLALAKDADKTFKEQVCQPEQRIFERRVNRIIALLTDAFDFKLNEMSLTDANTQSQIDERYVKNGVWLANEVRSRDGMAPIKGGDTRVDLNAKATVSTNKTPVEQAAADATANRNRDSQRSANATDSVGAARNPKGEGRTTG